VDFEDNIHAGQQDMTLNNREKLANYGGVSDQRNLEKWKIRTCVDYAILDFNFSFYIRYLGLNF
jgi:hypothetical protein